MGSNDDAPLAPRLREAEERYRRALAEIERLSVPDDHGAGERTARLAGMAAWEAEAERARRLLEELTGPQPPAHGVDRA